MRLDELEEALLKYPYGCWIRLDRGMRHVGAIYCSRDLNSTYVLTRYPSIMGGNAIESRKLSALEAQCVLLEWIGDAEATQPFAHVHHATTRPHSPAPDAPSTVQE